MARLTDSLSSIARSNHAVVIWEAPLLPVLLRSEAVLSIRWRLRDLNFSPSSRQMMKSTVTDFLIGTAGAVLQRPAQPDVAEMVRSERKRSAG